METAANGKLQNYFFLVLFIGALLVVFLILKPFLAPLILAFSLAVVFTPIYDRFHKIFKGKGSIAAFLTILLVIVIVLIPLVFIGGLLFDQARTLYVDLVQGNGFGGIERIVSGIQNRIQLIAPDVTINVLQYVRNSLEWMLSHLDSFFTGFVGVIIGIIVMLLALFYLLRDGKKLRQQYIFLSPLVNIYDEVILNKLAVTINSVLKGSLVIAIAQGIIASIGCWIFGLPSPVIWGLFATVSSLIPGVGTSLVMVPAILVLFVTGHTGNGIGLLIWQVLVVGLIDNALAPFIIHHGTKIHQFLILISVLGGLAFFGPIGFLLGPIILAFFSALLEIYPLIVR